MIITISGAPGTGTSTLSRSLSAELELRYVNSGELFRKIGEARKTEKEPHLTAGREIDAFFKALGDRVDRIKDTFTEAASAFHRAKAAEERSRVFDAFYQGATPQGGLVRGTGIGLSVVQEFVQAHGGTIELVDGEFTGAHFRVRLPAANLPVMV